VVAPYFVDAGKPQIVSGMDHAKSKRERILGHKIRAFWVAADDVGYGGLIKLLMLTTQRREKIVTMRRSDIRIFRQSPVRRPTQDPLTSERSPRHYRRTACYRRGHDRTLPILPTQVDEKLRTQASPGYAAMAATRPSADGQALDGPSRRKAGYQ
jgi:hypothetical protein